MMIALSKSASLDRWWRCVGARRSRITTPRPLAGLGYLTSSSATGGLIELEKLTLVVLHDEAFADGRIALRLSGFGGHRVPWGIAWGDRGGTRFYKDLRLEPTWQARGLRVDLANTELFELALEMEANLQMASFGRTQPGWRQFRLPRLWAGFAPADAAELVGDGPELAAISHRRQIEPQSLFRRMCRRHLGLVLFPLAWVSHEWQRALVVFADLQHISARQVITIDDPAVDLIGYSGAAAFNFYQSRFRERYERAETLPV